MKKRTRRNYRHSSRRTVPTLITMGITHHHLIRTGLIPMTLVLVDLVEAAEDAADQEDPDDPLMGKVIRPGIIGTKRSRIVSSNSIPFLTREWKFQIGWQHSKTWW